MEIKSFILSIIFCFGTTYAQDLINDTEAVHNYLKQEKNKTIQSLKTDTKYQYELLNHLLDLGEWDFVANAIKDSKTLSNVESALLNFKITWLNNDFQAAENILNGLKAKERENLKVQASFALLEIEAWELDKAEKLSRELLAKKPKDIDISLILGRSLMLQKKYADALALANNLIQEHPKNASGYFLKADVFFWDQKPKEAEEVLKEGLKINPLNADARFYYGYAIWRRIDATQLNDMVAQWDIALALNPLHFQSHWHLGNGHTNLTFADYVDENEKQIRQELEAADQLFTSNQIDAALRKVEEIEASHSKSILPAMHKASLLYSDFDASDRLARLTRSEKIFLDILNRKKHYGPAHNGLAAVIKSKRIPYLKTYDNIMSSLRNPKINNMDDFLEIFPDVAYYPGNVAKGMAWNQLYTSTVYFPFLVKQHRLFVIPPLHVDLALAMKAPYFRFNSTFDNRQWMDIRGVGSGAAAIEYVERGAFEERNVLLHEYVHLFHGQVLTDGQNRKIRELYYNAMEKGLTLDYYSQNNESEYFAQTYPAYFEKVKVHPLDFKSMNTLNDLKSKDPEMYRFLDELITNEKAYLAGDNSAMASNWSQVYVNLATNAAKNDLNEAYKYLDTALQYDSDYLPAHIAYVENLVEEGKYEDAEIRLEAAKKIDSEYAPIYSTEADLIIAKDPENYQAQAELLKKAYDYEKDYMEKAQNSFKYRNSYFRRGKLKDALDVAEEYMKNGSEISTYLRDRKDESKAFSAWQKALLGNKDQVAVLSYLASQKPQNYSIRTQHIEALIANNEYEEALKNLQQINRTLQASQVNRPEFELLFAEVYSKLGMTSDLAIYLEKLMVRGGDPARLDPLNNQRLIRLLVANDRIEEAKTFLKKLNPENSIFYKSSELVSKALINIKAGENLEAIKLLDNALKIYPYQIDGLRLLKDLSKIDKTADKILTQHLKEMEISPIL
ncbi:lipopolysaccharide assembly protein LapB [Sphingobacterium sp. 1.A.5]|jgi:tetratricopeptide (TPR) repeat protein|uniref:tetratricopeptide repeat protein n=1 Tax=Sphingobacterium sp. 1.A.5 TaxID=2044604 RepID=UPI000C0BE57B|nr:tetratricopeptide repeat protein [Sphingobacterium sp. 1.A.5]